MSYGGNVRRYLAARSERVAKLILIGTKLGLGVSGDLRQQALDFCAHWPAIIQAQQEGNFDLTSLSKEDQDLMSRFDVQVMLAWIRAMLDWSAIVPADFICPTLWIVGSEDRGAIASVMEYQQVLDGTLVQVDVIEGLDHEGVFFEVDRVFPKMLAFSESVVYAQGIVHSIYC